MTRRVLVYTSGLLPLSQPFVADQARALRRWSPTLVGRERIDDGAFVEDLSAPQMCGPAGTPSLRRRTLQRLTRRVPLLTRTADWFAPDLVHAHFLTAGFDVIASLRPLPCPVVVTAHGFDATLHSHPPDTMRPSQWLHGALRRRLLQTPINFIAVSTFIRQQLLEHGAPPERVVIHHIGVDTSLFRPPAGTTSRSGILFVGRLVEKKGPLDLLRAVARLRSRGVEVPVTMIGDGPRRGAIERFIAHERLDVHLMGAVPRELVLEAMHDARVLCAPSRTARSGDSEGFGMVLAEAQATGLPVVATTCGGMVDAVDHGRTGLLVPEGDVPTLADALERCLTDTALWTRLSTAARPWVVTNFDLHRQTARLEDLYDQWAAAGR